MSTKAKPMFSTDGAEPLIQTAPIRDAMKAILSQGYMYEDFDCAEVSGGYMWEGELLPDLGEDEPDGYLVYLHFKPDNRLDMRGTLYLCETTDYWVAEDVATLAEHWIRGAHARPTL